MKCERCNRYDAKWKVKNKDKEQAICEWCEESGDELVEVLEEFKAPKITYGRLHIVNRSQKASVCRVCGTDIPAGSLCYNQRANQEGMPFPTQTRVCDGCGKNLNESGVEIAK